MMYSSPGGPYKKNNTFNKLSVAQDRVEALEYLSPAGIQTDFAFQDLPSIVLQYLKLPWRNGLEVLRCNRSQEHTRLLPVIILTSSQEEDLLQTYNNGANSYIRKPVDFEELTNVAHQLVLYWLTLNMPQPIGKAS
ncbi:MAG: response regulator [Desulfohalobiaceae bacterium]